MAAPTLARLPRSRWTVVAVVVAAALAVIWWTGHSSDGKSGHGKASAAAGKHGGGGHGFLPVLPRGARGGRLGPRLTRPAGGLVRVSGTVLDAQSGATVSDVEVVFADGQSESSVTTDLAGRYTIDVPAAHYRPFVRADGILSVGHGARERLPQRPRSDEIAASRLAVAPDLAVYQDLAGVDLEVVRSAVVHGRVFDKSGHPIAGALVRAMPLEGDTPRPVLGSDVAETDLDGTFRLELASGGYGVDAFHDGYGAVENIPTVNLSPGDKTDLDLTMIAGCVITGRVVRADGKASGDGAIERAWSPDDTGSFFPAGDFSEDGEFRWTTGEDTDVVLRAWPWKAPPSPSRTFACHDGARYTDVVFEIPRVDADLGGTIVTARGAPAANAFIDVEGMSPGTMNQQERANGEGQWEVYALPPGTYRVTAYVEGEGKVVAEIEAPSRDNRLVLSGTGSLVGKVQGMTDGSFVLETVACASEHGFLAAASHHLVNVQGGAYRVDGVPACDLTLVASKGARVQHFEVNVEAGNVATLDVDLRPPQTVTVQGTVFDADSKPVASAQVIVMHDQGNGDMDSAASVITDASGHFSITAIGGDTVMASQGNQMGTAMVAADDHPDASPVDIYMHALSDDGDF